MTRLALTVFATVVVASQLLELFINRVLRPDLAEWTWISELLLVAALLVVTALWARLQLARTVIAELERERLRIRAELAVAAKVQRGLLARVPEPVNGISWHAVMEPAGEVGGDYYDFFPLDNTRMCVVVADVSGKGVPAAVFMSNTRAVIRAVAREGRRSPAGVLAAVSETLFRDSGTELYVTCILAFVDTVSRSMVYANAGHPPALILDHAGQERGLPAGGPPLALFPATQYDEERVTLAPGDLVVVVSDGITDALGASGERTTSVLGAELAGLDNLTPRRACDALLESARVAPGPPGVAGWSDDRTVVAFAVAREPSR